MILFCFAWILIFVAHLMVLISAHRHIMGCPATLYTGRIMGWVRFRSKMSSICVEPMNLVTHECTYPAFPDTEETRAPYRYR